MLFHKSEDLQNTFNKQLEETIPSATGILAPAPCYSTILGLPLVRGHHRPRIHEKC
jgi:hypothetical protein